MYLSATSKHPHPTNGNTAVIDWTFCSDWFPIEDNCYSLKLKTNLDSVFKDLCVQLSGKDEPSQESMESIIEKQQAEKKLLREISKLKSAIAKTNQFNRKVELNAKLKDVEGSLTELLLS